MNIGVAKSLFLILLFSSLMLGEHSAMAGAFDNRISMDKTPIDFFLGNVKYRIPRNYLYQMDNWSGGVQREGVSIRVVYPGLEPYDKDTESCMQGKIKCRIYDIYMNIGNSSSERNALSIINDPKIRKTKINGPYGYISYAVGQPTTQLIYYSKNYRGRLKIFDCQPYDIDGRTGGICHHFAHAISGLALSYFFEMNEGLKDAAEVDNSIENLINGFIKQENKNDDH